MDTEVVVPLLAYLQSFSAECLSVFMLIVCCASVMALFRFYGANGLYIYNAVAVVAANIQVLKCSQFWIVNEPLALGTITFATTYLVSDILIEIYGKEAAKRGVLLSFWALILMTSFMFVTLGFKPAAQDHVQSAMEALFVPSLRLLCASLIAFIVSQFCDIWIFQRMRDITHKKWLWLRATVSFLLSGLLDNLLFSILAWNLLSPTPLGLGIVISRYVLGTYLARILVFLASIPLIYYCRAQKKRVQDSDTSVKLWKDAA